MIDDLTELTPGEFGVMELVTRGMTNAAMAEHYGVTARAIEKHVTNALWKLTGVFDADPRINRRVLAALRFYELIEARKQVMEEGRSLSD